MRSLFIDHLEFCCTVLVLILSRSWGEDMAKGLRLCWDLARVRKNQRSTCLLSLNEEILQDQSNASMISGKPPLLLT